MITALKFACTATSNLPVVSSTFDSFLRALETDTPQKRQCRKLKADGSKDYNDYKRKNVPAWTLGVRFNGTRSNANAQADGYVTVDFDDVPDCESLKGQLAQCPHVLLAARSAGGNGVFCIVVTTPEIQLDPERIKMLWAELSRFTRMPVGAKDIDGAHIDGSCSDAARLRIESYDPCYVYNPDARIWKPFEALCQECYMGSQLHEHLTYFTLYGECRVLTTGPPGKSSIVFCFSVFNKRPLKLLTQPHYRKMIHHLLFMVIHF